MKACSRSDFGALVAGAITMVLGIFFWFPIGPRSVSLMPPVSLEGKTWALHIPTPPQAPAMPAPPVVLPAPKRQASTARKAAGKASTPPVVSQPAEEVKPAPKEIPSPPNPPEVKEVSLMAVAAVVPPGTLDPLQQYTMQELIDGFESDPSRYPLDRTVKSDGMALTLEGLQRRDKLFVLKVAVANGTAGDFFIKKFTMRAGTITLGSRTLFRILVEPRRVREGYVVFEKPLPGAAVKIKLEEDGGKDRAVETAVPYRF